MTRSLKHRGPDDHGTVMFQPGRHPPWSTTFSGSLEDEEPGRGQGGLGHTRLRVIDLSQRARQPMPNEDESVWIVYNGEIYNFALLRKQLTDRGHRFRSRSDTEVVLHAYEEWGHGCLAHFNGMFAFAILDTRKREIFLARDRLGIKPLYYCLTRRAFSFASELKALFQCSDVPKRLDPHALLDYLTLGYTPSPRSFFKDIRRLPPGHFLVCPLHARGGTVSPRMKINRYWDVRFGTGDYRGSEEEGEAELRELLADAVRIRQVSDVPLGAFLSGGVDSSAIVSRMVTSSSQKIRTFSVGFPEEQHNELPFARKVSKGLDTQHVEEVFEKDPFQDLSRILFHYDEPLADTSILPTFFLCGLSREHVTVCLSGDGGDELFAGYWQHEVVAQEQKGMRIPRVLRAPLATLASRNSRAFKIPSRLASKWFDSPLEGCIGILGNIKGTWAQKLLRPELLASLGDYSPFDVLNRYYMNCPADASPLERTQYVDLKAYLPEDILTKVDRASMAFGLEVRVPFLDHRVVEFAARLPASMRIREGRTKVVLKNAFSGILPKEVLTRSKQGFAIPEADWLRNGYLERIERMLLSPEARVSEILAVRQLPQVFDVFRKGTAQMGKMIWGLFILEEWMKSMDQYGGIVL